MPKVRKPDEASFTEIPFDPEFIAELMRKGYQVIPDDDVSDDVFLKQNTLVLSLLRRENDRKDWGEDKFVPELRRSIPLKGPPSLREDSDFTDRLPSPGVSSNYLNVKPNPFMTDMPTANLYEIARDRKNQSREL